MQRFNCNARGLITYNQKSYAELLDVDVGHECLLRFSYRTAQGQNCGIAFLIPIAIEVEEARKHDHNIDSKNRASIGKQQDKKAAITTSPLDDRGFQSKSKRRCSKRSPRSTPRFDPPIFPLDEHCRRPFSISSTIHHLIQPAWWEK